MIQLITSYGIKFKKRKKKRSIKVLKITYIKYRGSNHFIHCNFEREVLAILIKQLKTIKVLVANILKNNKERINSSIHFGKHYCSMPYYEANVRGNLDSTASSALLWSQCHIGRESEFMTDYLFMSYPSKWQILKSTLFG